MKKYLTTLIEKKGKSLDDKIQIKDNNNITYKMLVDYIGEMPQYRHDQIRKMLVKIDSNYGNVFHYLDLFAYDLNKTLGY